jgi:hypothetical protein
MAGCSRLDFFAIASSFRVGWPAGQWAMMFPIDRLASRAITPLAVVVSLPDLPRHFRRFR